MKEYDIIISGAGPAGLSAAEELSKNKDLNILLAEKGKIGHTSKTWAVTTELIKERGLSKAISHSFNEVYFHTYILGYLKKKINYCVLDQKKLLLLLKSRIGKNVRILERCSFNSFEHKDGFLDVWTSKGTFRCKVLIDASGFMSPVSKKYKLQDDIFVWQCFIYELNTNTKRIKQVLWDLPFESEHEVNFWVDVKNKKRCDIGFMYLTKTDKLLTKSDVKRYLLRYIKEKRIKKYKILGAKEGIVALNSLKRMSFDNIILVGNSASQAAPDSGYGFIPAVDNGILAAQVASKAISLGKFKRSFLKKYDKEWKKIYGLNYRLNRILQNIHYHLDNKTLNIFIDKMKGDASWIAKKNNGALTLEDLKSVHKKINFKIFIILLRHVPLHIFFLMLKDYFLIQLSMIGKDI